MWVVDEVLGAGEQVRRGLWHERAQRDLERPGLGRHADVVRAGGVDVDRVPADAGRVVEVAGARAGLEVDRHVLLHDASPTDDPAAFADVRMEREGVGCAVDVGRGDDLGVARPAARAAAPRSGSSAGSRG